MELRRFIELFWGGLQDGRFWALILIAAVEYLATWQLQRTLTARLDDARRERLGNGLGFLIALPWVGRFVMIPFAFVTRRDLGATRTQRILRGLLALVIGFAWVVAISLVVAGFELAITTLLGVDLEPKPRHRR